VGIFDWLVGSSSKMGMEFRPIRAAHTSGSLEPLHLAKGRGYTFEVVGESHRQQVLDAICGGKCEDGHDLKVTAQLLLVEGNPYDPNAVGVFVDCKLVGYVPRDLAPRIRADLLRLSPDERPVTCDGRIVGGWDRGGYDEGHYGIKLSLSQPLKLAE
jgi:hypothetical protein